jgi:hypothetical protein
MEESWGMPASPGLGKIEAVRSSPAGKKWGKKKVSGSNSGSRRGGGAR